MTIYRSSSTGGFGFRENFRPVKSQVAAWAKKHADEADQPIQEKGSKVEKNSSKQPSDKVVVTAGKQPPAKVVFTIGSPVREENYLEPPKRNHSGKNFAEICAWHECNKDIIAGKDDAYMYGYLQAFCSEQCRDKQIAVDEKLRPPSPISQGVNNTSVVRSVCDRTRINRSGRLYTLAQ
ncbi:hypothetical protein ACH5RR_031343 [Cinchona calisaya]|uniref:FLZ-type domain-containing protein n=1 Tax=Cinchona calisaya TaxID=153742 RepID=A0ABD2YGX2_9GENT